MTKDINYILDRPYVSHDEFKVPEGYFEKLSQRIMDNIPEEAEMTKKPAPRMSVIMPARLKYAIAACLTGLIVAGGFYTFNAKHNTTEVATAEHIANQEIMTDQYAQDCMEYAMVDEGDMYSFISEL